jgi:CheY-like chemotaxis protein
VRRLLGESAAKTAQKPLQKIVLLADDDSVVRGFEKDVLQQAGYQVLEAADGVDALSLFKRLGLAVDVLVTDNKMPRLDGIELVKAIRMESTNIPVVYISGEPLQENLDDPTNRVMFIPKQCPPQELLKSIRELLQNEY